MGKNFWTEDHKKWAGRMASVRGVNGDWEDPEHDEDDDTEEAAEEVRKYQMGKAYGVDDLASLFTGAHPSDLVAFETGVRQVSDALTGLSFLELQRKLHEAPPYDIDTELTILQQALDARGREVSQIDGDARRVVCPEHADDAQIQRIEKARTGVLTEFETPPVSAQNLIDAKSALEVLTQTLNTVTEEIATHSETLKQIALKGAGITQAGHLKDQKERLQKARENLDTAVTKPPQAANVLLANTALKALETAAEAVKTEIAGYGDTDTIDKLCDAFSVDTDTLVEVEEAFEGRGTLQAVAKAFSPADLKSLCGTLGTEKLAAALKAFGTPAALAQAMTDLGGADKLSGLLAASAMDGPKAKALLDTLGGGFVGTLMGSGSDPSKAIAIQSELGTDAATFEAVLKEGGFGTKPNALLSVLEQGCGGDAKTFVTFCNAFDDDGKRADLAGLIDTGGLGDAPKALGALVKDGFGGKADGLIAMGEAFKDSDARKGLGRMLGDGGLSGETAGVKADTLAMMLKHGAGPRSATETEPEDKRTATALAKLAKGMDDPTACTNLKAALVEGGLGNDPEVLGHLLGTGCRGSTPAEFNALTAELQKDPGTQEALKNLLQKGGFGTRDDKDAKTNVKPDCLAYLLRPGCDGKPDELVALLGAFDDMSRKAMKGVMETGDLGQNPKVIGQLYKHGCLDDPDGAHDGKKKPSVLTDMVSEFGDPGGPVLFKNMLNDSGFAEDGHEDRLASVVQHAFTPPRGGNKGKQQAKSLRLLASSFGAPANTFADLKTTVEALEGAPDHVLETSKANAPNQPGKGLRNIIHTTRFNGDPSTLKTEFFDKLTQHRAAGPTATETAEPWLSKSPQRMDLTGLLQTAASFEHEPIGPGQVAVDCGATGTINMDMDHAAGRHTRKHCKFYMNTAPQMGTTLYPRTVGTAELKAKTEQTVSNGLVIDTGQPPANRHAPPPGPRRTPPQDDDDFYGNFCSTRGNDDEGITNRIGFSKVHAPPYKVGQVFPKPGHASLVSVNNNDMRMIDNILNNKAQGLY